MIWRNFLKMHVVNNWVTPPHYELDYDELNWDIINYILKDFETTCNYLKTEEVRSMLLNDHYKIDRVIINEPATIIIWKDKTKTVVKCGENDDFNPEAGIALAYMKRVMFEDKTTQFNKWMNKQTEGYYYFL